MGKGRRLFPLTPSTILPDPYTVGMALLAYLETVITVHAPHDDLCPIWHLDVRNAGAAV